MKGKNPTKRSVCQYSLERKLEIVNKIKDCGNVAQINRETGIPTGTLHGWMNKYKEDGAEGLKAKSSRPNRQPKKTSQWIIDKIIRLKKERPEIGSSATSDHLARFESVDLSPKTISKIFKKHELPDGDHGYNKSSFFVKGDKDKRLERTVEKELGQWERFSRPNPNDLWQMDIMSFYIRDAHEVYLISALDDCSRMIVGWGLFKRQTADNVLEVLKVSLAKYGAPKEILTDQGAQFKHWRGVTLFEKLLSKINVKHIKARSHHPQTCGKIEAFHKTIHRELIDKEFFLSQEQAAERISRFVEHYNHARPHSALDGFTPADRYFGVINSLKKYLSDMKAPKNEHEENDERLSIGHGSKLYLVGKLLGQDIRLMELAGELSVHINNQPWKQINLLR